jgi:hypothetical protein
MNPFETRGKLKDLIIKIENLGTKLKLLNLIFAQNITKAREREA